MTITQQIQPDPAAPQEDTAQSRAIPASTWDDPNLIKLNDTTMKKTEGIPSNLNLKDPRNIAKVAMMDNETHPNVVAAVYNEMIMAGIPKERADLFLGHFLIRSVVGKSVVAQRVAITSYLTALFLPLGESAYAARNYVSMMNSALVVTDIITLFRQVPLDTLLKNDLPA